jgi:histone H2A
MPKKAVVTKGRKNVSNSIAGRNISKARIPQSERRTIKCTFPVGRVKRIMKEGLYGIRMAKYVPVFVSAILKDMTTCIIEQSREATLTETRKRIKPRDLSVALSKIPHLNRYCQTSSFYNVGIVSVLREPIIPDT